MIRIGQHIIFLRYKIFALQLNKILYFMQLQDTPGSQLRDKFTREPVLRQNHNDDEYINMLVSLGLQAKKSLYPSFFALKNGLQYPGMATRELIKRDEVLVKMPQKLILSSMKALKQPNLKDVFEEPFYKDQNCWEDRILLTYCLYLVSIKATDNIFYHMIQHMSKDIDVLFCWPQQELDLFKDRTVKSAALIDLNSFQQQWKLFEDVQKKYKILQAPEYNKQNYRWIFIHITSRSFGKAMDYTSFVPFCEFFNHHSSSVYYQIDCPKTNAKKQEQLQQEEELSSNGSHDSEDYIEQGQYAYDQIERVEYKWAENQCLDLDKKQKQQILQLVQKLLQRIETDIDWKDFSIYFAGHFIERIKLMESEYLAGRKNYEVTCKHLQTMKQVLQKYTVLIKAFYEQKKGKGFQYKVKTRDNLEENHQKLFTRPSVNEYKPQYTHFYLKTDKNDRFDPNTQVFFCYGPNSNRSCLLRYGFAIQGNKYEHVWLSYELASNLKYMPDLLVRIQKLGLSIRRKFKLNYTRLNLDLIMFFRFNSWNLYGIDSINQIFYVMNISNELLILQQVCDSIKLQLHIYGSVQQADLTDKSLNYHQYFVKVYHLQKKRIILRQIQLFEKLMEILQNLNDGHTMEEACAKLTKVQKYIFRHYLNLIVL